MVLVDTSVFITYLKGQETRETNALESVMNQGIPFGITSIIYQELLQGVRTETEFTLLKEYLDTQRFFELLQGRESYAAAALMFFRCQKKGITLRKSADLLIAQVAIENGLAILHADKDFTQLARVERNLRIHKA